MNLKIILLSYLTKWN